MTELKPPSSHDEIRTLIDRMIDNLITIQVTDAKGLWVNPDGTVVDDKSWKEWGWPQGVGLYGIWKNYEITGNPKALKTVTDWFDQALTRGTPGKNVNSVAPILTLAFLYERTGEPSYLPYLKQWGAWIYRDQTRTEGAGIQHVTVSSNNHNQLWADTLVMTVLALAKIGKVLGRPEYVEEAKYQFLIHAKFLMDPSNGLWFHGWSFDDRNNFSAAHWGRGNCWATIAIPEVLSLLGLDEHDAVRRWLVEVLREQVETLSALQDPVTGLWHTLVDDPNSYLESSATAGFAYGILKAVHERFLAAAYLPVAYKAVEGLIGQINDKGEVERVSVGTGIGDDWDYYRTIDITPMPYGQSLTVLAFTELLVSYC